MREEGPSVQVVVRDASGDVVNRVDGPASAGIHRVAWDLTLAAQGFVEPGDEGTDGELWALPGTYTATLEVTEEGQLRQLAGPMQFDVEPLYESTLARVSPGVVAQFRDDFVTAQNELDAAENLLEEQLETVAALHTALMRASDADAGLVSRLEEARQELLALQERMDESEAMDEVGESGPPTPGDRLNAAEGGLETTHGPTAQHRLMLDVARAELAPIRAEIERMAEDVVPALRAAVEGAGAPPIRGRGG